MTRPARTIGVDMSTSPKNIGCVALDWPEAGPALCEHLPILKMSNLATLLLDEARAGSIVAVDVPFGWPSSFAPWLTQHTNGDLPAPVDIDLKPWSVLASRRTDADARRVLREAGVRKPGGFSVSFDKLGATAACWASIEAVLRDKGVTVDRSGQTYQFLETWPSAAWRIWHDEPCETPPNTPNDEFISRLDGIVDLSDEYWSSARRSLPHAKDALVCALVARAVGGWRELTAADAALARLEGWIHLPKPKSKLAELVGGHAVDVA